ncbi:MAG TPA: hypothetical protein VKZ65_05830 [Glycomyces sp.]|nr:hypothetical protein [Glycomyces sp.]
MNAEQHGDHAAEPGDEAIAAAFAAYRAEAPSAFAPPPVDELIMSGPAALRRRRLVSLAAVLGACTAVTAGGFAVAQTLGSLPKEPEQGASSGVAQEPNSSEHVPGTQPGTPTTPGADGEAPPAETTGPPEGPGEVLVLDGWAGGCAGGSFAIDTASWEFADETAWTVAADAAGDLDGDGAAETVLALSCEGTTGVAAFTASEDGLEQLAWVWQPDESQRFSEIADVADGVITLQGSGAASATWTARYEWDGEAFVAIDEAPATEPSSSATTETPDSGETQTTETSPSAEDQVS